MSSYEEQRERIAKLTKQLRRARDNARKGAALASTADYPAACEDARTWGTWASKLDALYEELMDVS